MDVVCVPCAMHVYVFLLQLSNTQMSLWPMTFPYTLHYSTLSSVSSGTHHIITSLSNSQWIRDRWARLEGGSGAPTVLGTGRDAQLLHGKLHLQQVRPRLATLATGRWCHGANGSCGILWDPEAPGIIGHAKTSIFLLSNGT